MLKALATAALLCSSTTLFAEMVTQKVTHTLDGVSFEGTLVYDNSNSQNRPAILMVPNWMGPTENSLEKAKLIAGDQYVVLMADVYGVDVRPKNADEAKVAATTLRSDRPLLRKRTLAAVDAMLSQKNKAPIDASKVAAIGFCFGGGAVLELARAGSSVDAVVSFHGNLDTPNPQDAKNIQSKVLVLHGADDPYVPATQVSGFEKEMRDAGVDWQLVSYGNTVHSFTNPKAKSVGKAHYNATSAKRAYATMHNLFDETFKPSSM